MPISGIPGYDIHNRTPYSEEWMFSIERQAGPNTVFTANYVGTASHHQRVLVEANPGNPALCLSLSQAGEVQPGTPTCGPGGENGVYDPIAGGVVNGTRTPLGPNFGSDALQSTIGNANYNALELSARHTSGRLEFSAAYTYGKSLDQSSNIGEEVNPFNPALSRALSSFDVKHNFVLSYEYQLPFDRHFRPSRLSQGWSLSGITHFASGFPVTLINNGDNSLIGTNPNGINNSSIDEPDYTGDQLHLNRNPRTMEQLLRRDGLHHERTWDTRQREEAILLWPGRQQLRYGHCQETAHYGVESVAISGGGIQRFYHTQFSGPGAVDGDIGSSTFGQAISAAPPRIMQGSVKFNF